MKRILAAVTLAIAAVSSSAPAMAAPGDATANSTTPAEGVVIGGRTFGPQDGLVHLSGTITLGDVRAQQTWNWGNSYVSTNERWYVWYDGEAFAAANFYDHGKVVIQTKFKYTRGGVDLTGWQESNAVCDPYSGWRAGPHVKKSVMDSMNPIAPKTEFHYDVLMVSHQEHCQ